MAKRICFIGGGLKGGGQERSLTSLAEYFAGQGYEISIINLFKTEKFFEVSDSISVFWPKHDRNKYNRIVYALLSVPYLRKHLKRIHPDVILSYGEWFNPFVILSTRFLQIPLYVLDRMGPQMVMDSLVTNARKALYRLADGIIVQTNVAASIVKKNTRAKNIAVIPNPVNVINARISNNRQRIVTLGRLSQEKGHKVLLHAFSRLRNKNWTLHIIGDGPERKQLEEEALTLGVAESVIFYGHVRDFSSILGESDIFVLPSYLEGYPNALLEAMSVPLPCISSDCIAGPSDIIRNGGNGILVKPGDIDDLARAMNLLVENENLRKELAAEAYLIRDTHSFDKIARQYLAFIFPS